MLSERRHQQSVNGEAADRQTFTPMSSHSSFRVAFLRVAVNILDWTWPTTTSSDRFSIRSEEQEKRYDDRDHLENDLRAFFASRSPEFYANGIHDLVRPWQKVVDVDGDYFLE
ncbi:hypothetical protein RB195_023432 [Necator americanus]|uniref:Uncharacterized protein n=1 Tax=Necator americanus TaxID=51031 RepID=A0ABR1EJ74_NECAM